MPITPEQARQELARRELARRQGQQPQQQFMQQAQQLLTQQLNEQQGQQLGDLDKQQLLKTLITAGGVGAVGYGAYRGGLVPAIQKRYQDITQKQNIINTLKDFQKQLGIEGTEAEYIPKRISELETSYKTNIRIRENEIKYRSDLALQNAKSAVEDFDNKILSSKVENLSKTLEENYPTFLKNASQGYKAGMDAIDSFLVSKNIPLNSLQFEQGFLDKAIAEGISRGLTEAELAPLLNLKTQIAPKFNAQGILAQEQTLPFSRIKGYISGLTQPNPNSKLSALVNKNWLDFLEQTLPDDVSPLIKGQLSKLNMNYKQFAEARFQYSKIISRGGEFNRQAANKYLLNYFKSNIDDGTQQLITIIGKGNDIVNGIQGVEEKFNAITQLKPQRGELIRQIGATKQLKQEALNQLADDATKNITRLRAMRSKADEFISRLKVRQEQQLGNKLLAIPRILKALGRLGRGGITALAIVPSILDAYRYSQDPEAYLYQAETGEELAPKGTERREIQTGRLI